MTPSGGGQLAWQQLRSERGLFVSLRRAVWPALGGQSVRLARGNCYPFFSSANWTCHRDGGLEPAICHTGTTLGEMVAALSRAFLMQLLPFISGGGLVPAKKNLQPTHSECKFRVFHFHEQTSQQANKQKKTPHGISSAFKIHSLLRSYLSRKSYNPQG